MEADLLPLILKPISSSASTLAADSYLRSSRLDRLCRGRGRDRARRTRPRTSSRFCSCAGRHSCRFLLPASVSDDGVCVSPYSSLDRPFISSSSSPYFSSRLSLSFLSRLLRSLSLPPLRHGTCAFGSYAYLLTETLTLSDCHPSNALSLAPARAAELVAQAVRMGWAAVWSTIQRWRQVSSLRAISVGEAAATTSKPASTASECPATTSAEAEVLIVALLIIHELIASAGRDMSISALPSSGIVPSVASRSWLLARAA
ncbi:hypothetical protein KC316_g66 [Hortaea werneckii]|nr:hypothetical protein KC316_g66 [Hortaea werneckii]